MKVGMVGIGGMGKRIAINIAKAGFEFTVNDLREAPMKELEQLGAQVAGSPREVAAASDIVLVSLPNNEASEQVALGPDGALAGAKSGDIYVDLSTIVPSLVHKIAKEATARGVCFLDAPVSGTQETSKVGGLSIMVGGDAATLDRAMPVFKAFGKKIFHAGDTGAGATVKLVNNLLAGINMVATYECLILGTKAGLSVEVMRDVISASSGSSLVWNTVVDQVVNVSPEPPAGEVAVQGLPTISKDMRLAMEMAQELSVPLSIGATAQQAFLAAMAHGGWPQKEYWVMMDLFEEFSAVRVPRPDL